MRSQFGGDALPGLTSRERWFAKERHHRGMTSGGGGGAPDARYLAWRWTRRDAWMLAVALISGGWGLRTHDIWHGGGSARMRGYSRIPLGSRGGAELWPCSRLPQARRRRVRHGTTAGQWWCHARTVSCGGIGATRVGRAGYPRGFHIRGVVQTICTFLIPAVEPSGDQRTSVGPPPASYVGWRGLRCLCRANLGWAGAWLELRHDKAPSSGPVPGRR